MISSDCSACSARTLRKRTITAAASAAAAAMHTYEQAQQYWYVRLGALGLSASAQAARLETRRRPPRAELRRHLTRHHPQQQQWQHCSSNSSSSVYWFSFRGQIFSGRKSQNAFEALCSAKAEQKRQLTTAAVPASTGAPAAAAAVEKTPTSSLLVRASPRSSLLQLRVLLKGT